MYRLESKAAIPTVHRAAQDVRRAAHDAAQDGHTRNKAQPSPTSTTILPIMGRVFIQLAGCFSVKRRQQQPSEPVRVRPQDMPHPPASLLYGIDYPANDELGATPPRRSFAAVVWAQRVGADIGRANRGHSKTGVREHAGAVPQKMYREHAGAVSHKAGLEHAGAVQEEAALEHAGAVQCYEQWEHAGAVPLEKTLEHAGAVQRPSEGASKLGAAVTQQLPYPEMDSPRPTDKPEATNKLVKKISARMRRALHLKVQVSLQEAATAGQQGQPPPAPPLPLSNKFETLGNVMEEAGVKENKAGPMAEGQEPVRSKRAEEFRKLWKHNFDMMHSVAQSTLRLGALTSEMDQEEVEKAREQAREQRGGRESPPPGPSRARQTSPGPSRTPRRATPRSGSRASPPTEPSRARQASPGPSKAPRRIIPRSGSRASPPAGPSRARQTSPEPSRAPRRATSPTRRKDSEVPGDTGRNFKPARGRRDREYREQQRRYHQARDREERNRASPPQPPTSSSPPRRPRGEDRRQDAQQAGAERPGRAYAILQRPPSPIRRTERFREAQEAARALSTDPSGGAQRNRPGTGGQRSSRDPRIRARDQRRRQERGPEPDSGAQAKGPTGPGELRGPHGWNDARDWGFKDRRGGQEGEQDTCEGCKVAVPADQLCECLETRVLYGERYREMAEVLNERRLGAPPAPPVQLVPSSSSRHLDSGAVARNSAAAAPTVMVERGDDVMDEGYCCLPVNMNPVAPPLSIGQSCRAWIRRRWAGKAWWQIPPALTQEQRNTADTDTERRRRYNWSRNRKPTTGTRWRSRRKPQGTTTEPGPVGEASEPHEAPESSAAARARQQERAEPSESPMPGPPPAAGTPQAQASPTTPLWPGAPPVVPYPFLASPHPASTPLFMPQAGGGTMHAPGGLYAYPQDPHSQAAYGQRLGPYQYAPVQQPYHHVQPPQPQYQMAQNTGVEQHRTARLRASGRHETLLRYDPHATKTAMSGSLKITPHFPTFQRYMKAETDSWGEAEAVQFLYTSLTMEVRDRLQTHDSEWVPRPGETRMQHLMQRLKDESVCVGSEESNYDRSFESLRMTGSFQSFHESWLDLRYKIKRTKGEEPLKTGMAVRNHVLARVTQGLREGWTSRYFDDWTDDDIEERRFWRTLKKVSANAPELTPTPQVSFQVYAEDRPRNTPIRTRELTPGPQNLQDLICYGCGAVGHIKRDCPRLPATGQRSQSRSPGRGHESSEERGRPRSRDRGDARSDSRGRSRERSQGYTFLIERMEKMERRMEQIFQRAEAQQARGRATAPPPRQGVSFQQATQATPPASGPGVSFQQAAPGSEDVQVRAENTEGPVPGGSEHLWVPS